MSESMSVHDRTERTAGYTFILIFSIMAIGIVLIGYLYYLNYERDFRARIETDLSNIAKLKVGELALWRKERLGDGSVLFKNETFSALVRRFLEKPGDTDAQRQLQAWMGKYLTAYQYSRVALFDTQGRMRISAPQPPEPPVDWSVARNIAAILRESRVVFQDFHREAPDGPIYLAIVVPIFDEPDDSRPLGVLALYIDPTTYLYPFIARWPTSSQTGETLLVRRDGDDALFLSELRFRENAPLNLRIPLTKTDVPAVRAALGQTGVFEGVDYRGAPVIAAVRPVPDSSWAMVARMNTSEVYTAVRERLWETVAFVGVLLFGSGVAMGFVWRQKSARYRERDKAAEAIRVAEERYRSIFAQAADAIWLVDAQTGAVVEFNTKAHESLGYTREEFGNIRIADIELVETADEVAEHIRKVIEEGSDVFETKHRAKNGETRDIIVSANTLTIGGRKYLQSILRDITERKQLEQQLSRRLRHRDVMERITRISLISANAEELLGRALDEMLTVFNADRAWFLYPCDPDAPSWSVPMERTRPEWPGALARGMALPMTPEVSELFRQTLASTTPLPFGPATSRHIPAAEAELFSIRSQILMALRPRVGSPWVMGLHHCAQARAYGEDELLIFNDIGQRVADALSSIIILKNLRESEENLNRAQAVGQIGSWLLNIPANRLEWSAETYRMFGVPQQDAIDLETFFTTAHPDDRAFVRKAWSEAITGAPYDIEHRIVVKGETRWVRERAQIERDPEGRALTGIGTVQDITERKKAEEALRESEQKFLRFFMMSPIPLGVVRNDGAIVYFNDRFTEVFGYTRDDVPTIKEWWERAYPDESYRRWVLDTWGAAVAKAAKEGTEIESIEYKVTCKNGEERIVLIGGITIEDNVLATFLDITERKRAGEALVESESRFREIFNTVNDAIFIHDAETGRIIDVNHRMCEMYGRTHEEALACGPDDMSAGAPPYSSADAFEKIRMARAEGPQTFDWLARARDGHLFWVEVSLRLALIGGQQRILALARDMTERKRAEEELRLAKEQAESATKLKDQFVSLVAHDLRSPFISMMGLLKDFAERKPCLASDEDQKVLDLVFKSGDRMMTMIDQLLKISRLQTGQITPHFRFFKGHMAVAVTIGSLSHNAAQKGIVIINEVPVDMRLYADPSLFDEVLLNLLSNAIKFCSRGDKITIFIPPGLKSAIAVRDTGKGVSEKIIPDIFKHEVQTSRPGTAGELGSGLGLPYSHDIMRAHGGELTVESAPGKGAVFCAMLPYVRPIALTVDDDPAALTVVRNHLEKIGIDVIEALDGEKALSAIKERRPHIIITDIIMPGMDGFALLDRLKHDSATSGIPVIVITSTDGEAREKALRHGADDFVSKPIEVEDFIPRVRRFVG